MITDEYIRFLSMLSNDGSGEMTDSSLPQKKETDESSEEEEEEQEECTDVVIHDDCCTICFESGGRCVFMNCGHGLYCRPCANKLIVRPPHSCPVCRQRIHQVNPSSICRRRHMICLSRRSLSWHLLAVLETPLLSNPHPDIVHGLPCFVSWRDTYAM